MFFTLVIMFVHTKFGDIAHLIKCQMNRITIVCLLTFKCLKELNAFKLVPKMRKRTDTEVP